MEEEYNHKNVFADLERYNTVILYKEASKDMQVFEKRAGSRKIYINLRSSEKLEKEVMRHYGIEKLPCMMKFGHKVYLDDQCEMSMQNADKSEDEYYKRLVDDLVNSSKMFLFIKGRVESPKCKFTRSLLSIMAEKNLVYKKDFLDFDILSDERLREKIKVMHGWPTFPQIFVNGKLLGGLDALKQSIESGSLDKMLE